MEHNPTQTRLIPNTKCLLTGPISILRSRSLSSTLPLRNHAFSRVSAFQEVPKGHVSHRCGVSKATIHLFSQWPWYILTHPCIGNMSKKGE